MGIRLPLYPRSGFQISYRFLDLKWTEPGSNRRPKDFQTLNRTREASSRCE